MTDTSTRTDNLIARDEVGRKYQHYSGGTWSDADDSSTFEDYEPYTGEVFARVAACGRAETKRAIEAAAEAFEMWSELPPLAKANLFQKAANILETRESQIIEFLSRETGATLEFAHFQHHLSIQELQQAANWVYLPKGDVLQSNFAGTFSVAVRRPLGVVASFTPWNGASVLAWRALLSPLAAGNTVVVKPSELAPVSAGVILAEVCEEAGFPAGVVNVITHAPGGAATIADEFFDNPDVRCINFIGSANTARILAERAGRALKRSVMELGGYNPLIILEDTDMDYAVRIAAFSAFFHQGQVCMNSRKILVQRGIYDEFVAKLADKAKSLPMGDPQIPGTVIGPLITKDAVAKVHDRVQDAIAKGARVVTGGRFDEQVYEPTILVDVAESALVSCEETFGPVVVVEPVDTPEQAIEIANRVPYCLSSAILSGDTYRAFELAGKIKAGAVHVNLPTIDDEIHAPVGGVRDGGWGRSGPYSLEDFTDLIWIDVQSGQRDIPIK